jgi:Leucine Rich repeat
LIINTTNKEDELCFRAGSFLLVNRKTVRKLIIWCLSYYSNATIIGSHVTINGWKAIFLALQDTCSIDTLILDASNFNYQCATLFATELLNSTFCSALTHLSIRNNDQLIGIEGVSLIVEVLCANPIRCNTVRKLTLEEVIIYNEGTVQEKQQLATQFVTLCTQNGTALEELNLVRNYLDDDFVSIFVTGLKANKAPLKKLILSDNAITGVGGKAIANVLYYNRTLVVLDLSYNCIPDDCINEITIALRYQPTLRCFRFSIDNVPGSNLFHILNFLEYNESMVKVSFNVWKPVPDYDSITKRVQSLIQYNDTIKEVRLDHLTNHFEERTAPNKGVRRRQHIFTWLNDDWLGPTGKATKQVS